LADKIVDISWIKIKTKMFDDEKILLIESMPEADAILVIWIRLLIQAGKTNSNGYIFLNEKVPYTPEMLSTIFRRPLSVIKLALKTLSDLEMIEMDRAGNLLIANWEKHQSATELEKIRESNRIRQQRFRENQKLLNSKKEEDTEQDIDIERNVTVTLQGITKIWAKTFGRNPKIPEQDTTQRLIDKFGIEKTEQIMIEAVHQNFHSIFTLEKNLDENGNIKPKVKNGANISKGATGDELTQLIRNRQARQGG